MALPPHLRRCVSRRLPRGLLRPPSPRRPHLLGRKTFPDPKPATALRRHRLVLDGTTHASQLRAAGDTGQGFPEILPPAPFRFELPDGSLCESPCWGSQPPPGSGQPPPPSSRSGASTPPPPRAAEGIRRLVLMPLCAGGRRRASAVARACARRSSAELKEGRRIAPGGGRDPRP